MVIALLPAAGDVLEGDRRVAEEALGELLHAGAALAALERVGEEHGVVIGRDADAVAAEDEVVVFVVLRDLQDRGVLEQRLQPVERVGERDLALHHAAAEEVVAALAVAERDVAGLARRGGEADADEVAAHRVERGRLRVDGDAAERGGFRDPVVQPLQRADGLVGLGVDRHRHRRRGALRGARRRLADDRRRRRRPAGLRVAEGPRRPDAARPRLPPAAGPTGALADFSFGSASIVRGSMPVASPTRLVRVKSSIALRNGMSFCGSTSGSRSVASGTSISTLQSRVTSRFDRRACSAKPVSSSRRFGCLISGARASSVSRSPYSPISAEAVFTPMPGTPGHVVGGVADQRLDVDHLLRRHAEILDHPLAVDLALRPVAGPALGARFEVVEEHLVGDELHQVLVGGDEQHLGAGIAGLASIGGDQVVGLEAGLLDRRQPERLDRRAHQRELRREVVRHLAPGPLVVGVDLLAEGLVALVEDDGEVGRHDPDRALADELVELGGEQPHRAGRHAVGAVVVFRVLVDRLEIGAEDEGRPVDQENMVAGTDRAEGGSIVGHGHYMPAGHRRAQ